MIFSSYQTPGPIVCNSHFTCVWVFLPIFLVKVCFCLIFHIFQLLAILQVLQCGFLICHVFECFSPYFSSYHVCFAFSMVFSFLAIHYVLRFAFLFSMFFIVSSDISHPKVCICHFPCFQVFFPIFQVI